MLVIDSAGAVLMLAAGLACFFGRDQIWGWIAAREAESETPPQRSPKWDRTMLLCGVGALLVSAILWRSVLAQL